MVAMAASSDDPVAAKMSVIKKRTAKMPDNCWANISTQEMRSAFRLPRSNKSEN